MENWRKVFRDGLAPLLSVEHLEALKEALESDDPALLQGSTMMPPFYRSEWLVEGACLLAYPYAAVNGGFLHDDDPSELNIEAAQAGDVEAFFAQTCSGIDQRLADAEEPTPHQLLLEWFDETPRDEMRINLLPEIERELTRRGGL